MAVNTDSSRRFDVGRILKLALRVAGLAQVYEDPDETILGEARDMLDLVLDNLAVDGVTAATEALELVSVTAGTFAYQLSAHVLDVLDPAYWAAAGEAEPPRTQSPLTRVSAERWRELQNSAEGNPAYVYPRRCSAGIEVCLYPNPSDSGTLRLRVQRMLMDAGPGTHDVELAPFWTRYLVQATAAELAQANGLVQNAQLALTRAEMLKERCLGKDSDNVPAHVTFDHPTIWSGR